MFPLRTVIAIIIKIYAILETLINHSESPGLMDKLVKLTSDLMKFKTTADRPDEIRKCADFIISFLRGRGMIIKTYIKNSKISIVALFQDTKKPDIFLNAHFDVVPASIHTFTPKISGNKLYGRGSEDCKSQVAVLMAVMAHFAEQKTKPNIGIMLTSDEEVHGHHGVEYLLAEQGYNCNFALVADGGDNFDIVTKHKGVLQIKVSATGKSAHSARSWEGGDNAIEKLIAAGVKIRKMFPKPSKAVWRTTANINKIQGGDALNKIPDYAEFYLDVRRTEKDTEEKILKKLKSITSIQVETIASADMLNTNPKNTYVKKLKTSAQKVLKRGVKLYHEHGATDARYFSERKIPAVVFKAMGYGAHSEAEYLLIPSLRPFYNVLIDFINTSARTI